MLWSHMAAFNHTYASTRLHKRTDHCKVLFPFADNDKRLNWKLGDWGDRYDAFNRWTRLAAVLAMKSYLETYISQICNAALESCPALLIGGDKQIDGISLLKNRPQYSFTKEIESLVRGEWKSRIASYKKIFGTDPLTGMEQGLDKLRRIRNDVGHSFGRDINWLHFSEDIVLTRLPLIEDVELQQYLGLVECAADAVEADLASRFVGAYETLRLYHVWRGKLGINESIGERAVRFKKKFGRAIGDSVPKYHARQLIEFYENA